MARSPFVDQILDVVVPAVCGWVVSKMRALEERGLTSEQRWEELRMALERMTWPRSDR